MTDEDARGFALGMLNEHDPAQQVDNPYKNRCEICHFTRHPCDVYELAKVTIALLERA